MILAMFAMVLLTIIVGLVSFKARVSAVKNNKLALNSFLLMDADDMPESVVKTTRNLNNQFEVPVLFYAACLSYLVLGINSDFATILAWLFVVGRAAHAYIHISYNALNHRMLAFTFSLVVVVILWTYLAYLSI